LVIRTLGLTGGSKPFSPQNIYHVGKSSLALLFNGPKSGSHPNGLDNLEDGGSDDDEEK